jgi:AraC-like DNA-binding protein
MARKDSISMQMVREALYQSALDGPRREQLLTEAGIAPAQLHAPLARVSVQAYGRLWRRLARAQDDEFFGMDARPLRSGSFAFISRMAVAQPTLAEALDACLAFLGLMLEGLPSRLQRQDHLVCLVFDEAPGTPRRPFTYFTYWLIVHGLASWLVDRRLPTVALELRCAAPEDCTDYQALFNAPLRFEQAQSRLLLAAECLRWPVRRSAAEVERFLARAPDNILVRYRDPDSLAQRLRLHLRGLPLAQWPEIDALAAQWHMSTATLRRRLGAEGQAWQGLKDSVRRELACAWLAERQLPLAEVAERLGFADTRGFYKAFQRWTGLSPGAYRDGHTDEGRIAQFD